MLETNETIIEQVKLFLQKYIGTRTLSNDDNIFGKGLVNSLFAMQLVLFLEKTFDIQITNEDLNIKNFETLKMISNFVLTKGKAAT